MGSSLVASLGRGIHGPIRLSGQQVSRPGDFSGGPVARIPTPPLQGTWVQPLVGELRFFKPRSMPPPLQKRHPGIMWCKLHPRFKGGSFGGGLDSAVLLGVGTGGVRIEPARRCVYGFPLQPGLSWLPWENREGSPGSLWWRPLFLPPHGSPCVQGSLPHHPLPWPHPRKVVSETVH